MFLNLNPCQGVGEFILNRRINNYDNYRFNIHPIDEATTWTTYELEDYGLALYVENEKIVSISCDKECFYKRKNIIGMHIESFKSIYNLTENDPVDEIFVNDDVVQQVYEFDAICLQVWCEQDIISTVIASTQCD